MTWASGSYFIIVAWVIIRYLVEFRLYCRRIGETILYYRCEDNRGYFGLVNAKKFLLSLQPQNNFSTSWVFRCKTLYFYKFLWEGFWCFLFSPWIKWRYFPRTCCWAEQGRQQQMGRTGKTEKEPKRSQAVFLQRALLQQKHHFFRISWEPHTKLRRYNF